ncbi:tRNA A64-2'-O-ribosylphosphate transferase [Vanrija pseudolonga]|uniref:tRNA A64-2'-O-ribosylphosphate transferase n=1 Tax=Vanrija pseudolonga TaxID=143232 RepID=A0AAF1BI67_9TREE|nr:tRNA A64-2'-O-ribosylphosphate transferase [Vanrija pseudolonga]
MNDAAKAIKKHAAQHDLFNRLHSIAADERFVQKVAQEWFSNRFEVIANQRCGTWYCDPSTSSKAYAYFKSTDGHTLNWDFNLRRSNLSLASYAEEKGGFLLVDSTRRGKRMPDGLSKTVPIWCSVVNRAVQRRRARGGDAAADAEWDTTLYLPAQIVSPSEKAQIEPRLDVWAESLETSVLPLPELKKPLRPFFIHPATSRPPVIDANPAFTPIICVSASRWVNGEDGRGDPIPTATRLGDGWFARTVAFDYVPGAGDDDELWGRGLKPALYHEHKADLLSTPRDELPGLVDDLVEEGTGITAALEKVHLADSESTTSSLETLWTEATVVSPTLLVDLGPTIRSPQSSVLSSVTQRVTVRVVDIAKPSSSTSYVHACEATSDGPVIVFSLPSARTHPKEYGKALGQLVEHLQSKFPALGDKAALLISPGQQSELDTAVQFSTIGEQQKSEPSTWPSSLHLSKPDLQASQKSLLPLLVALTCSFPKLGHDAVDDPDVDKGVIAARLHSLVALWPEGNPPRAALKRVNEFLMS